MALQDKRCAGPATYEAHKAVLNEDVATVLPPLLEKMEWGTNELILDHGCSTGSTGIKYFAPYAEKSNSTIYALDNRPDMIKFASENFTHPRVKYVMGTLTDDPFPSPVKDLKFNKIFSIYTMQFIDDYRRELKALYDSLVPGGEMYVISKLHVHFFDLFDRLAKHKSYGHLAKADLPIPRWLEESEHDYVKIIKDAFVETGFEIKDSFDRENSYVFESPGFFADLLFSLNGFAKNLSSEERDEMRESYHKYFRETETKGHKPHADSANSEYTLHYHSLYIHLKKPE